jgi:pSer/pThr/pTyr-binding forkhead associated (FHA) protein
MTRRIIPQKPEAVSQKTETVLQKPDTGATATLPAASVQQESNSGEDESEQTKARAFAYLRYADQNGQQTFEVTKNQVVIGRGGRSFWVDVKLETLPDVSREHCRIRRDGESGRFTIEDVSQFGTAVNGKPVGRNASAELPQRGTISLAGVIDLQWEAV